MKKLKNINKMKLDQIYSIAKGVHTFGEFKSMIDNLMTGTATTVLSDNEFELKQVKNLNIDNVSVPLPSDDLIEQRGQEFESKTYYNLEKGEKIGDFEVGAKWVVDYLKGNER